MSLSRTFLTDGGSAPAREPRADHALAPARSVTRLRRHRGSDWQPVFLENLRSSGNVSLAALAAGIDRSTAYVAAAREPAFAAAWQMAADASVDVLEAEARRRAMAGSDQVLMFLLRGLRPEVYRRETPDVRREIQRAIEQVAACLGVPFAEVLEDVERRARELGQ